MRIATVLTFLALGLVAQAAGPIPRPAKELTVTDPTNGTTVNLASQKGKVVVVQFLFTWCPHCQAFSKMLSQLNTEYGPKGFTAVGMAFDETNEQFPKPDVTPAKIATYHQYASFPVGIGQRGTVVGFMGHSVMESIGVPQIAVIDKQGNIRAQSDHKGGGDLGVEANLRKLIEQLLAEGGPSKSTSKAAPPKTTATAKKSGN